MFAEVGKTGKCNERELAELFSAIMSIADKRMGNHRERITNEDGQVELLVTEFVSHHRNRCRKSSCFCRESSS